MKKNLSISNAEMEVMRVLWVGDGWKSVSDVCQKLAIHEWNYKTVGTFLLRLLEKKAVELKKEGRINYYRPTLTEADYKKAETERFLREIHGGSMSSLLAALYTEGADTAVLEKLTKQLEQQ